MSGEQQRDAAMRGDDVLVKEYILERANTCSSDEFGLTPLHYAVWNGHLECVKLLVSNNWGVSAAGVKCRGINLQTTMGLTGFVTIILAVTSLKKVFECIFQLCI